MTLLAIDLGLRAGFAEYSEEGRLVRYGSTNFGTIARLKKGAFREVGQLESLSALVVEGDLPGFIKGQMSGTADALTKNSERSGAAQQRLIPGNLGLGIGRVVPDQMDLFRVHLIIQLCDGEISNRVFFRQPYVPKIVHVETDNPLPVQVGLDTELLEKGCLTLAAGKDHTDFVLFCETLPHHRGNRCGGMPAQL